MQLRFVNRTNMAVCVLVLKNAKCFVVAYKISWAHYLFSPPLGGTVTVYCLSLCCHHTCWALMVETVMQILSCTGCGYLWGRWVWGGEVEMKGAGLLCVLCKGRGNQEG